MDVALPCETADFLELSKEVLGRGASLRFRARGRSMQPLIRDQDLLEVAHCGNGDVVVGDVVLFSTNEGKLRAHRIVHASRDHDGGLLLKARGDATGRLDAPVRGEQVLGKVTRVYGQDGRVRAFDRGWYRWLGRLIAVRPGVLRYMQRVMGEDQS